MSQTIQELLAKWRTPAQQHVTSPTEAAYFDGVDAGREGCAEDLEAFLPHWQWQPIATVPKDGRACEGAAPTAENKCPHPNCGATMDDGDDVFARCLSAPQPSGDVSTPSDREER